MPCAGRHDRWIAIYLDSNFSFEFHFVWQRLEKSELCHDFRNWQWGVNVNVNVHVKSNLAQEEALEVDHLGS